jgi:hypothetical protein
VTAGTGLTGGGNSGNVTLAIGASYQLPQGCSGAQLAEWSGTSWGCVTDLGATSWQLTGNAGTNPATDYLGTSDNQPLNLEVNGQRALQLRPDPTSPNLLGGFSGNTVDAASHGQVVAGGGASGSLNRVSGNFGTVSGGWVNSAGTLATVVGGQGNTATGQQSTVGGGANEASGFASTAFGNTNVVSGTDASALGDSNTASGTAASALGDSNAASGTFASALGDGNAASGTSASALGDGNTASGTSATAVGHHNTASAQGTFASGSGNSAIVANSLAMGSGNQTAGIEAVAIGLNNTAAGGNSVALGSNAQSGFNHSFVWSDGTQGSGSTDFSDTGAGQFDALASGGFNFQVSAPGATYTGCTISTSGGQSCTSDRNAKHAFRAISGRSILDALARMPIRSWSYKLDRTGTRHIGPTAQDFMSAFQIGANPRMIGTLDEGGVSLAGEQALYRMVLRQERQIKQLQAEVAALKH